MVAGSISDHLFCRYLLARYKHRNDRAGAGDRRRLPRIRDKCSCVCTPANFLEKVGSEIRFSAILKEQGIQCCDRGPGSRVFPRDQGALSGVNIMFSLLKKTVLTLGIFMICGLVTLGQNLKTMPFAPGETLSYEAKLSKIISGVPVADLTFVVSDGTPGVLNIRADAKSKGTMLKLAR